MVMFAGQIALFDRVLEQHAQLLLEVVCFPIATGVRERECALARRLDEARALRESVDEGQDVGARHLASGVRQKLLLDAPFRRLEDLTAHGEADVVLDHVGDEAREVRGQVHAQRRLVERTVRVTGHGDATQPRQRDFVEDDQGLVVVLDAVTAELHALDGADEGLLQRVTPTSPVPGESPIHPVEQVLGQDPAELDDRLLDELSQSVREPLHAPDGCRFVGVQLVEFAHARRWRLLRSRGIVVEPIDVSAQRERVEDPTTSSATLTQDRVADILRDRPRARAETLDRGELRLHDQRVPAEDREARLQVVARHVGQMTCVQELGGRALVARRLEVQIEDRQQSARQQGQARFDDRRLVHPIDDLSANLRRVLGNAHGALSRPEAIELGQIVLAHARDGIRRARTGAARGTVLLDVAIAQRRG